MSQYSAKIRDHAHKTSIQSADPLATLREVIFCTHFRSGLVIRSGFSNLHFQNLLPDSSCPPRAATTRGRFDPVESPRSRGRKESAVKPGSVVDSHSSGMRVAAQL